MLDFSGLVLANWITHSSQERIALQYIVFWAEHAKKKVSRDMPGYRRGVENGGTL